jgi:ubiquinone/menaquinone biosynthesis C-methylase UbiE
VTDYTTVTETWGLPASDEQLAMQHCRYEMAARLARSRRVLEVGCGTGMGLAHIAEAGGDVIGGDYTRRLIFAAREHMPSTPLVRLDAQRLPFKDRSFGVVLMLEMIYYVRDSDQAVAECRRVLDAGGHLLVCLPNRDRPDFNPSPMSHWYPSATELSDLLSQHRFRPRILAGFPSDSDSERDRRLAPLRRFAVRHHLVPGSMRLKSAVKRLLYGRLPRMGEIRTPQAYPEPVEITPGNGEVGGFKNLYAVGEAI